MYIIYVYHIYISYIYIIYIYHIYISYIYISYIYIYRTEQGCRVNTGSVGQNFVIFY